MDKCFDAQGAATLGCVPVLLGNIVSFGLKLAAVSAIFYLMFAGISFMTSGGDLQKVANAKKSMTYAILGLVIIVLSYSALLFVGQSLGLKGKGIFSLSGFEQQP